ncbi:MAG: MBL fold metallo-hydrolase [Terracidiphilus sp.]|jgi:7,8-dihydropterin-6-yl-methyl-4-(beta-D-ribofuranosyl)aminobenzene 5'-phosphate synthase
MNRRLSQTVVIATTLLCSIVAAPKWRCIRPVVQAASISRTQIRALKVTLLSTMLVAEPTGIGEWGFSALIEADGHRILLDTGARPETVLQNAREMNLDLSGVQEVILTHNHDDHVGGLLTLRRAMMKKNPAALSVVYVARGIFYSRPSAHGESNPMIAIRREYESTGGRFVEYSEGADIFPGAWLTGPVPRKFPERNWSVSGKVQTPDGLVEDTIPEDQSLVLDTTQGLVVVTGCGHAGIVNILTDATAKFPGRDVDAVIGGLHLFAASDEQLDWTGDEFKQFKVANLIGAHCTGIEAVYRLRQRAGLTRHTAVVGAVGSTFTLDMGIVAGALAE